MWLLQALAAVLSDGSLAAAECPEEDDWEFAAEESHPNDLPENVTEDVSTPGALSMPLVQLLSREEAYGFGLMHARCSSHLHLATLAEQCGKSNSVTTHHNHEGQPLTVWLELVSRLTKFAGCIDELASLAWLKPESCVQASGVDKQGPAVNNHVYNEQSA